MGDMQPGAQTIGAIWFPTFARWMSLLSHGACAGIAVREPTGDVQLSSAVAWGDPISDICQVDKVSFHIPVQASRCAS